MFLILVLGVVLVVALVIMLALPTRLGRDADATADTFGHAADQLRPATLRLEQTTEDIRSRRLPE